MEKIERFAWQQLRDYLLSVDALGVPNAIQALLDADEPAPEGPRYIPKGVPCVVWMDPNHHRCLRYSVGYGEFVEWEGNVEEGYEGASEWDHARPVCFPAWEELTAGVRYIGLRMDGCGVWTWAAEWYEEDAKKHLYYETRPEVTK